MATIALYAGKVNRMPGLIGDAKKSVMDYKTELSALRKKTLQINKSVCNLDDVISRIQTSTQTQEQKAASLEAFQKNSEQFIADTVRTDSDTADAIRKRKEDFYDKYYYLKPKCEKNDWEKFCDDVKAVGEWCKENWQSIAKIVAAVVIIAALGIASVLTGGVLAAILAGAFWGALAGGVLGGVMGGITSAINGGSFLEGFADGALSGAVTGAITGAACAGIGLAGQAFGKGISCLSNLGKAIKVTSKVTRVLSSGMDGFDMLAMGIGFFDPENPLVQINQKLHSSVAYNIFQVGINGLAVFTGAASSTMKCFVAGTMVLTATGLVAIENIKAGDRVISTNTETFETTEKTVLETYVREDNKLIHLLINGEEIITTETHPFYVKDEGFINAINLYIGDKLLDSKGNTLLVEDVKVEITDAPTTVYNFQVEDFHTYYVGNSNVLVHNANCKLIQNKDGSYDVELSYKEDWTPEQRAQADAKCKALTEADTVKTDVAGKRDGTKTARYRIDNSVPSTQDVDHIIDLQLGGADDALNMKGLDKSVNRSLGKQINILIKELPEKTVFRNFIMK